MPHIGPGERADRMQERPRLAPGVAFPDLRASPEARNYSPISKASGEPLNNSCTLAFLAPAGIRPIFTTGTQCGPAGHVRPAGGADDGLPIINEGVIYNAPAWQRVLDTAGPNERVHGKGPCLFSLDHIPGRLFDASDEFCEVSPRLVMGNDFFIKFSGFGFDASIDYHLFSVVEQDDLNRAEIPAREVANFIKKRSDFLASD